MRDSYNSLINFSFKILDYIEHNHLLDNFENLKVYEDSVINNIYFNNGVQHFQILNRRKYQFNFYGFEHDVIIPLEKEDITDFSMSDDRVISDKSEILNFLRKDISKNHNLIPFLCFMLNINFDMIKNYETQKEIHQLNKEIFSINHKIAELSSKKEALLKKVNIASESLKKNPSISFSKNR